MKPGNLRLIRSVHLLIIAAMILSACAFPAPAQQPTSGPAASPAPSGSAAKQPSLPPPATFTAVPENTYWQTQTLLWGGKFNDASYPVLGVDDGLQLLYVERLGNNLDLGVLSGGEWKGSRVAGKAKDFQFLSLEQDPGGGLHLSYYNPESGNILYGKQDGGQWQIERSLTDVQISALTLVISPQGNPGIVFFDQIGDRLRFLEKTGDTWRDEEILGPVVVSPTLPALYGPDQRLHLIAYQRERGVVFLSRSGAGLWETQVIDPQGGSRFSALAFAPDGSPAAAYYDTPLKALKYARFAQAGWQISTVDDSPGVGTYPAIAVGLDNRVHISYFDAPRGLVKYAFGTDGDWEVWILDENRKLLKNTWLELDPSGNPRIYYADENSRAIRLATVRLADPGSGQPKLTALHRSGQTFLTWEERVDLRCELYRVYRSDRSISRLADLDGARLVGTVGEQSSRFYASYHDEGDHITWRPRYMENLVINDGEMGVPGQVGLLVWTIAPEDLGGNQAGNGHYAVTITPENGKEQLAEGYAVGPVQERVEAPRPVEITRTPGMNPGARRHIYIQYMDLHNWNATFHAPNQTNSLFGFPAGTPGLSNALQYAYDYTVFEPSEEDCGGPVPERLPVYVMIHGYRGNRYGEIAQNPFPFCAYGIYPIDITETWYFGFAQKHDYRAGGEIQAGDVVENYTEQRVLRMVSDLLRNPPGPPADEQRVYLFGHSMGGSGTLALAERYPDVFAAAYSGQPITNYATAGVTDKDWAADVSLKWGKPALNLPIEISAPNGWGEHLSKYNGSGVWDWQNTLDGITRRAADDMTPLAIDHGTIDSVIIFSTQGEPLYPALVASGQAWSGLVNDFDHDWSNFAGMPPWMGNSGEVLPFWNFSIIRDETVPGFSNGNPAQVNVPGKGIFYHANLTWSSSWNPWDGPPVDEADTWQMSLCAAEPGSSGCQPSSSVTVDITPRRLQRFRVTPGDRYRWQNQHIPSGAILATGEVTADANGKITVTGFQVAPGGSRLIIEPFGGS